MTNKLIPCASQGKRYATNICAHLAEYLQYVSNKKTKGLVAGHSVLISTGESLGQKITYQSGNGSPVILNFCPFCGGKLHSINDEG
jgi:hypothetical protein|nr:MAG TPA: restriction alleviation protein [Caudoviricetes sp.]